MIDRSNSDYPQGDGNLDCPLCHGRGGVTVSPPEGFLVPGGIFTPCACVRERDHKTALLRRCKGILEARPLASGVQSMLWEGVKVNLRITAPIGLLMAHLRATFENAEHAYDFRFLTDEEHANFYLPGIHDEDIYDPDIYKLRKESGYEEPLDREPPPCALLVLWMEKRRPNRIAASGIAQLLSQRGRQGQTTWLCDDPDNPWQEGHISWNADGENQTKDWLRLAAVGDKLIDSKKPEKKVTEEKEVADGGPPAGCPVTPQEWALLTPGQRELQLEVYGKKEKKWKR